MDPNEHPPPPEAPDKETMDKIRQRRLEKLGSAHEAPAASVDPAANSPKPSDEAQENTRPVEQAQPRITITPSQPAESAQSAQSAAQDPGNGQSPSVTPTGINAHNAKKRRASEIDATSATPLPHARRAQAAVPEPLDVWADKNLCHIFRVTVDPHRSVDVHGHKLRFLPDLHKELQEEGKPLKLGLETIDSAILEAATAMPRNKPLLDYLLPCWKRVIRTIKTLRNPTPEKTEILKEARRLCMSHCTFALTMPDLYSREETLDVLGPYLLNNMADDTGIDLDFINEAISRFEEDPALKDAFTQAMVDTSRNLSTKSMLDDYKPYVNALVLYSKFPPLLDALAEHPSFNMTSTEANRNHAPLIETKTILGPFFRISPLQGEVTRTYFPSPKTMGKGRIHSTQDALRMTLSAHQMDLKGIVNAFIRASVQTRGKVLDWFAHIMNVNHKRRAMQVNPLEVASDGFMMNVTAILDTLCEPFMDATFSRVDRIHVDYWRRNPRVDIKDETKLNADQAQSDAFYARKLGGESNFISEVFFLTLAAHHYGSEATNQKMKTLDKDIKYFEKQLVRLQEERNKILNRPLELARLDQSLKQYTEVMEKALALKHSIEGVLVDEKMQARSLQFMRHVTVWLLRIASRTDYTPQETLDLPLPEEQPEEFSCLPEYVLQDIVDNFKFVWRFVPQIILSAVGDEIIALCITFLESSEYIRNPYLKSSLVSLLFNGTWPTYHLKKGVLGDALSGTKFANDYLLHALMKFYIECESTGAHTQFYDKFNIRYEIFQVIKCVWPNDIYKQRLTAQSKTNRPFFVRFVNLLLNDATYVLDEALTRFPTIHDLQHELRYDSGLSAEDREKKEEELQTAESQAQSYMQLANETVAMMKLFTNALSEAFTMPEIVQRLAGMLDYNLDTLVGPKSTSLKVENPSKYYFNPRSLLAEIVDIYLNLGSMPSFVEAVASDGRSYKPSTFDKSSVILRDKSLIAPEKLEAWKALKAKFASAKEILDQAEMDLGDIPEEYEDPIMGDLMKDPVILPSKHIVDRSTISQHLLSDPHDPFTRQPMTIDDVIPADDLRNEIETWREGKMKAAKAKIAETAATDEAMDTTEG